MMEKITFTERLMEFGLTRQEATIYQCLLGEGKMSGYEVAKQTGISRSNAYNSLASMTEKGAAYLVEEGNTRKYVPVPVEEFCKNRIRRMEEARQWLKIHVPSEKTHVEGYITIEGARNILDKMRNLLDKVEQRVYISCTRNYLLLLVRELEELKRAGKKVVIVTDQPDLQRRQSLCGQKQRHADRRDCGFQVCIDRRIWRGQYEYLSVFRTEKFC